MNKNKAIFLFLGISFLFFLNGFFFIYVLFPSYKILHTIWFITGFVLGVLYFYWYKFRIKKGK